MMLWGECSFLVVSRSKKVEMSICDQPCSGGPSTHCNEENVKEIKDLFLEIVVEVLPNLWNCSK
jgi:hypothetical protein